MKNPGSVGRSLRTAVPLVVALVACLGGRAGAQAPAPRVRVGLALGGGSARGLAHIGVLRWFEEHRVPIDIVAGTSMGALVGAAYATGMSPDEIRDEVAAFDWASVLSTDGPFVHKTFRRKEDARAFPSQLRVGFKDGFKLATGLSPGAQVELLLDRLAAPYPTTISFDDLPTPFRCVATDLRSASTVVFDSGWLARALRSTMAIPGLFAPVEINGQMLVDGAVLDDVPADVVKATRLADVIVAVDLGVDLTREKRPESLFAVLGDTLDAMTHGATRRTLELADLVVTPDLTGFNAADFSRADALIGKGYQAAESHASVLLRYALGEADYAAWVAGRQARRRTALPVPTFIAVEGVTAKEAVAITRRLSAHLGRPLDPDRLDNDLTNITGAGRYDSASYRLDAKDGRIGLTVAMHPKSYGPPFLLAALDVQNTQASDVRSTARGRVVLFDVAGAGSEGRVDFSLGTTLRAGGEIYRPIGRTGVFLAPHAFAERRDVPVFIEGQYAAEYRTLSRGVGLDAGYSTERRFEARFGYGAETIRADTRIGTSGLPTVDGTQQYLSLSGTYDGQTGPTIPERGAYLSASLRRFFETPAFRTADGLALQDPRGLWSGDAGISWFHPLGARGRLFLRGAGGTSFGSATIVEGFTLGGPFRLGAFSTDELRGSNYLLGNAGYFRDIARLAEGAVGRLYFGAWLDEGATFERIGRATFHTNASAGFVLESPVGPVFVGASVGGGGRYRLYIGVGPIPVR